MSSLLAALPPSVALSPSSAPFLRCLDGMPCNKGEEKLSIMLLSVILTDYMGSITPLQLFCLFFPKIFSRISFCLIAALLGCQASKDFCALLWEFNWFCFFTSPEKAASPSGSRETYLFLHSYTPFAKFE